MSRGVSDKITYKPYSQSEQWLFPPSLGEWRANGRLKRSLVNDNPVPHETGHLLGLDDRYSDVEVDGKARSQANEGWRKEFLVR